MAISKVIYGEDTLIDLTADTVTPETLAAGTTAHNSAGETVTGVVTLLTVEEITQQAAQKVDKEGLGLSNVDNTSDMNKPVSTAQLAALSEKAPAGYGLGEIGGTYVENINIVRNGWYRITPDTVGGIGNYALVRVDAQTESSVHQTAYSGMATSSGFVVMKRVCFDGSWGEWEYENPPMVVGEEYRTTERYNGEAVIKKADTNGGILWRTESETSWHSLSGSNDIFWATYGKTTGVEIYNAYAAGKLVMCKWGEVNYILSYCGENWWQGEITGAECWFIPINVPVWATSTGNVGALYLGLSDNWSTYSNGGILDYIVAQGICTTSIAPPGLGVSYTFTWNYRKWASGVAECWGESAEISFPILSFNNCVYLEDFGSCAFPISFTEIPAVSCSFVATGQNGAWGFAESVSTTGVGRIQLASDRHSFTGRATIRAIGRWK